GLVASRGGPRELEAQTSLKRAALNLRNAREAADTIARRVAETLPPGTKRSNARQRPPRPVVAAALTPSLAGPAEPPRPPSNVGEGGSGSLGPPDTIPDGGPDRSM